MTDRQLLALLTAILYADACRYVEDTSRSGLDTAVEWARSILTRVGTSPDTLDELPS